MDIVKKKGGRPPIVKTEDEQRYQAQLRIRLRTVIEEKFGGVAKELAMAIGMDPTQLSKLLKDRPISQDVLWLVSRFTGVSSEWLVNGQGQLTDRMETDTRPSTVTHEGQALAAYLDKLVPAVSDRKFGIAMGLDPRTASSEVGQYRKTRRFSEEVRAKILSILPENIFVSGTEPVPASLPEGADPAAELERLREKVAELEKQNERWKELAEMYREIAQERKLNQDMQDLGKFGVNRYDTTRYQNMLKMKSTPKLDFNPTFRTYHGRPGFRP